jgi:hypothetical protein
MVEIVLGMVLMVDLVVYFEHYVEVHLMIEFKELEFLSCWIEKGLH